MCCTNIQQTVRKKNLILNYKLPKKKENFESFPNTVQAQQIDLSEVNMSKPKTKQL